MTVTKLSQSENEVRYKIPLRRNAVEAFYNIISKFFSKYIVKTSLTPNHITVISGTCGLIGALFLIPNRASCSIIAGVLIQVFIILDFVDGDIARMKDMCSRRGAWLDTFFDKLNDYIMIICLTIGVYYRTNIMEVWLAGLFLMGGQFSIQFYAVYSRIIFEGKEVNNIVGQGKNRNNETNSRVERMIRIGKFIEKHLLLEANTFWFLLSLFAFGNQLFYGLICLAVFSILTLIFIFVTSLYRLWHNV